MNIFIINPKAGNGKGIELIPRLNEIKEKIIYVTKEKGDATKFLLDVASKYPNSIVYSVGGDGTLNEVVNGIYDTNCSLHIVPFGSGNDYHRIIKNIYEDKVDIGDVNGHKFINIASIGIDADIVDEVNKDTNNFLKYQRNILKQLIFYKKKEISIAEKRKLINILTVCKGKYYGNGVPINPNYNLNNHLFNLIEASNLSNLEMLKCFLQIFRGKHLDNSKVNISCVTNLQINSKLPILCNVDGEVFQDTSFNFKLIPDGITVTNNIPAKIKRMIYDHSNI